MAEGAAIAALVVSLYSANEQRKASNEAAKDQKEANKVKTATQRAADIAAMRQKAREERVRRARIQQAAENTGVGGSSGEVGALSAIQTNLASANAFQAGTAAAAGSVTRRLNSAAGHEQDAAKWGQIQGIANTVFGATGGSLYKSPGTNTSKTTPTGGSGGMVSSTDGRFSIFD